MRDEGGHHSIRASFGYFLAGAGSGSGGFLSFVVVVGVFVVQVAKAEDGQIAV